MDKDHVVFRQFDVETKKCGLRVSLIPLDGGVQIEFEPAACISLGVNIDRRGPVQPKQFSVYLKNKRQCDLFLQVIEFIGSELRKTESQKYLSYDALMEKYRESEKKTQAAGQTVSKAAMESARAKPIWDTIV